MNLGELADLTVANDNDLSMDVITLFVLDNAQDVQTHIQKRWDKIFPILPDKLYLYFLLYKYALLCSHPLSLMTLSECWRSSVFKCLEWISAPFLLIL